MANPVDSTGLDVLPDQVLFCLLDYLEAHKEDIRGEINDFGTLMPLLEFFEERG